MSELIFDKPDDLYVYKINKKIIFVLKIDLLKKINII